MATPTSLPATFVAGDVLTAAQMNNLRGAFRILQVVSANHATQVTNSTSTFADTGLTVSITPTSTSSKVLVIVNQAGCGKEGAAVGNALVLKVMRGATDLLQFENLGAFTNSNASNYIGSCGVTYLDSPATTSATTYKTQFKNITNAAQVSVQANNSNNSSITLMEISA
jgi:hypothetical protein